MKTQTTNPTLAHSNPPIPTAHRRRPRRRRNAVILLVAISVASAAAGAAWWLGLLTPEPAEVSLQQTVAAVTPESTDLGASTVDDIDLASIAGEWTVVTGDATFVGYRADNAIGEAVGRSPGISGTLTASETQITAVEIAADMTQLKSDSSLRDDHLGDEGLEYNTHPTSTFSLTDPIDIEIPEEGTELAFEAVGELTVRDITHTVTVALDATTIDGQLIVVGSTDISLDDFGASVRSTEEATMEFSLVFSH